MQRDLYSAYLARFDKDDILHATEANSSWSSAEPLLRAAWRNSQQLASGMVMSASFVQHSELALSAGRSQS